MSLGGPAPTPALVPPSMAAPSGPPAFGMFSAGQKPQSKSTVPTFLGSLSVPGPASGNFGGKTLLGT